MTERRRENAEQVADRWNAVFRVLAAEPRRQIIVSLLDKPNEQGVALPESAMNPEIPVDFDDLTARLHHQHLPLLADEDVITWERDPLVAYRGPRFDEAAVVLWLLRCSAHEVPDSLVVGCRGLERERQRRDGQ